MRPVPGMCASDPRHGPWSVRIDSECQRLHTSHVELCSTCTRAFLKRHPDGERCRICPLNDPAEVMHTLDIRLDAPASPVLR